MRGSSDGSVTVQAFNRRPRRQSRYTLAEEMKNYFEIEPVTAKPLQVIGGLTREEEAVLETARQRSADEIKARHEEEVSRRAAYHEYAARVEEPHLAEAHLEAHPTGYPRDSPHRLPLRATPRGEPRVARRSTLR